MKKTKTEITYARCDNEDCRRLFKLTAPSDILEVVVEARTFDEKGTEIAPREYVFVCPKCQERYANE